jgi:hypothetical protein
MAVPRPRDLENMDLLKARGPKHLDMSESSAAPCSAWFQSERQVNFGALCLDKWRSLEGVTPFYRVKDIMPGPRRVCAMARCFLGENGGSHDHERC